MTFFQKCVDASKSSTRPFLRQALFATPVTIPVIIPVKNSRHQTGCRWHLPVSGFIRFILGILRNKFPAGVQIFTTLKRVKTLFPDAKKWHHTCDGIKLSLIHISEPTRLGMISYAVFCLKKKKK